MSVGAAPFLAAAGLHISSMPDQPSHADLPDSYAEVDRLIVCNLKDRDRQEQHLARRFDDRLERVRARVAQEFGAERARQDVIVLTYCRGVRRERAFARAFRDTLKSFVDQLRAWERRYAIQPDRGAS